MRMLFSVLVPLLVLVSQAAAYFPVSKFLPMTRYNNIDYYTNSAPACTLNLTLTKDGASGYMDVHYRAVNTGYSSRDSLEIYSILSLPRSWSVDSMVLWVGTLPQPASLVSIGQAEATYNDIVYVKRMDPAYIRRVIGYPNNYGTFPFRPYENQFEVKVFPCFQGGSRHIRIFVDCHNDLADFSSGLDLGRPLNTVVRLIPNQDVNIVPQVSKGRLAVFSSQGSMGFQINGTDTSALHVSFSEQAPSAAGYTGAVQLMDSGSNYFKLAVDLEKLLGADLLGPKRRVTFAWVPSTLNNGGTSARFEEERNLLATYISGFRSTEAINIVYGGAQTELMEPHMVPAQPAIAAKAQQFLASRVRPSSSTLYRNSFDALAKAFGSIASSDTPAVVFCLDREPMPQGSGSPEYARQDSAKNVLVQINVNRAKFFAWVHWSKSYFYGRLAALMNGSVQYYDPYSTYQYPNWTTSYYSFDQIDNVFNTGAAIAGARVEFRTACSNVITSRQVSGFDLPGVKYGSRMELLGQCDGGIVGGTIVARVGSQEYSTPFCIYAQGTASKALNLNKLWAFDMAEVFSTNTTTWFMSYARVREYSLSESADEFMNLYGTLQTNACTYRTMVDMSIKNKVVTAATALLALEPGMEMVEEDSLSDDNGGSGPITGAEQADSRDEAVKAEKITATPNPFNPVTTLAVNCGQYRGAVVLRIFDASGKLVRTLEARSVNGHVQFTFNGCVDRGVRLASGVYLARATMGSQSVQMKLMLMK